VVTDSKPNIEDSLNNVRREGSRCFRAKRGNTRKVKTNKFETKAIK
jgi:hypothetical protein